EFNTGSAARGPCCRRSVDLRDRRSRAGLLPPVLPTCQLMVTSPPELWRPRADARQSTAVGRYLTWLATHRGLSFDGYADLWSWSVDNLEQFWSSVVHYFAIDMPTGFGEVLSSSSMPGSVWFPGSALSYASHALRNGDQGEVALVARSQSRPPVELTWD